MHGPSKGLPDIRFAELLTIREAGATPAGYVGRGGKVPPEVYGNLTTEQKEKLIAWTTVFERNKTLLKNGARDQARKDGKKFVPVLAGLFQEDMPLMDGSGKTGRLWFLQRDGNYADIVAHIEQQKELWGA